MSYTTENHPVRAPNAVSDYELIDSDPHFSRVISYMRPLDLGVWAALTVAMPAALVAWEKLEPSAGQFKAPGKIPGGALRVTTLLGFFGGFYLAYIRSSKRFLGWLENNREVAKDRYEVKKLLSQGKNPYHTEKSNLDDRLKDTASKFSQYSFLNFAVVPWFNWAYHPYHGVDLNKYYEDRPGEEAWGFKLKPLSEIPK